MTIGTSMIAVAIVAVCLAYRVVVGLLMILVVIPFLVSGVACHWLMEAPHSHRAAQASARAAVGPKP